ncbi:GSCOCG00005612001-RA-CDS [Cotesia congregata]|uniref:Similar to Gas1: Growth arrest-specific protein 1 (Mus musculus) n=1 Tax=Cotesia congregata TaxID=51543 RepID=A0A8J2HFI9_COTCN|nr:GSCOCG00005612001-RA-CDS [Cotesia congregata]CAG5099665.1 Similar to Gas1: Growth arrest-specific protein 1 (Mus musculus) [Cotesia congregata]
MNSATHWVCIVAVLGFTAKTDASIANDTHRVISCDEAKLKCGYRKGCGGALQRYLTSCAGIYQDEEDRNCPEQCQLDLISLTSTDEGKDLMNCRCTKEDFMCIDSKQKVEVCRESINRLMNNTRLSCKIATGICNADTLCFTALQYYHKHCKHMFNGRRCTHRCRNSLNILLRQDKAASLKTCVCDGREDYDCRGVHRNMHILCFNKTEEEYSQILLEQYPDTYTNEVGGDVNSGESIYFRATYIILIALLILLKVYFCYRLMIHCNDKKAKKKKNTNSIQYVNDQRS